MAYRSGILKAAQPPDDIESVCWDSIDVTEDMTNKAVSKIQQEAARNVSCTLGLGSRVKRRKQT